MPIHRESHPDDVDLMPGTTKSAIAVFHRNLEYAYSPSEIAAELDVPKGTARTTLRRLHEDGTVGVMDGAYYHGLGDRADLRRYAASVAETAAMFETHPDGEEAPEPDLERAADTAAVDDERLEEELDALGEALDR